MGDLARLGVILVASAVVLAQTVSHGRDWANGFWTWALLVSLVSCAVTLATMLCVLPWAIMLKAAAGEKMRNSLGIGLVGLLLTAWWIAGVGVLTFRAPFTHMGNGYFGSWAALAGSWLLATSHFPWMSRPFKRLSAGSSTILAGLLLTSLVVLIQTALTCGRRSCGGPGTWILVCSAISTAACLALALPVVSQLVVPCVELVAFGLVALWTAGAYVATFVQPFTVPGNGYFGSWASLVLAMLFFWKSWHTTERGQGGAWWPTNAPIEQLALLLASAAVFVAAILTCRQMCGGSEVWAIICSLTSMAITVGLLMLWACGLHSGIIVGLISFFLLGLWTAGVIVLTFHRPFTAAGNGYFASWIALFAAMALTSHGVPFCRSQFDRIGSRGREMTFLLIASGALLLQAAVDAFGKSWVFNGWWLWALICGGGSLLLCLSTILCVGFLPRVCFKCLALFFFLWWAAGAATLTFVRPYYFPGNGYFATWLGLAASAAMLHHHSLKDEEEPRGEGTARGEEHAPPVPGAAAEHAGEGPGVGSKGADLPPTTEAGTHGAGTGEASTAV